MIRIIEDTVSFFEQKESHPSSYFPQKGWIEWKMLMVGNLHSKAIPEELWHSYFQEPTVTILLMGNVYTVVSWLLYLFQCFSEQHTWNNFIITYLKQKS